MFQQLGRATGENSDPGRQRPSQGCFDQPARTGAGLNRVSFRVTRDTAADHGGRGRPQRPHWIVGQGAAEVCTLISRAGQTRKGTCPARARKLEKSLLRHRLGDRLLSGLSGSDETVKEVGSGRWNLTMPRRA